MKRSLFFVLLLSIVTGIGWTSRSRTFCRNCNRPPASVPALSVIESEIVSTAEVTEAPAAVVAEPTPAASAVVVTSSAPVSWAWPGVSVSRSYASARSGCVGCFTPVATTARVITAPLRVFGCTSRSRSVCVQRRF